MDGNSAFSFWIKWRRLPLRVFSSKKIQIDLYSTRVDQPMLESKFCWFQANKVVFYWGRIPIRLSSTKVVFHWGYLQLRVSYNHRCRKFFTFWELGESSRKFLPEVWFSVVSRSIKWLNKTEFLFEYGEILTDVSFI
jgi:hypothetical protein